MGCKIGRLEGRIPATEGDKERGAPNRGLRPRHIIYLGFQLFISEAMNLDGVHGAFGCTDAAYPAGQVRKNRPAVLIGYGMMGT